MTNDHLSESSSSLPLGGGGGTPPIAVVVAMPQEMTHLEGLLRVHGARWEGADAHGPRRFDRIIFNEMPLVLTTCWVGMVAAAAATEAVIARYHPRAVLNYGCTGAHREDILLGDVVVGTSCVAYDHGRLRAGGTFEHTSKRLRADDTTKLDAFPTSTALLAVAESVAGLGRWRAEPWPEGGRAPRVFFGPVGSADRFTQDADALRMLHARHATLCEDMEAAAIAQICALHDLPFLTIKDISNNEFLSLSTFGEAGTFKTLEAELGKRAAAFLFALIEHLATMPDE